MKTIRLLFSGFLRKTAVLLLIVCAGFAADFSGAFSYKLIKGYSWNSRNSAERKGHLQTYRVQSSIYHHGLINNADGKAFWDGQIAYPIHTNSLGLFDKSSREVPLITDKYRMVFIGDSFVEGIGIAYPHTFVGLIDEEFSKKDMEVLNAGVTSYSPIIYWRKTKYLIEEASLKFNELVVFLDISDPSNEAFAYRLDEHEYVVSRPTISNFLMQAGGSGRAKDNKMERFLKHNTILTYVILDTIRNAYVARLNLGFETSMWTLDENKFNKFGKKGLQEMSLYMDKLYSLLQEHEIRLTVAVYPWPDQIINRDLDSVQVRYWQEWCDRHGVDLINYFPYFVAGKTKEERNLIIKKYFIKGDVHWNNEGHRLVADVFLKYLQSRQELRAGVWKKSEN